MKFYFYKVIGIDEKDSDIEWITVKGNHIPIKKGSSKEETGKQIAKFFEKKDEFIKTNKETKHSVYTGSGKHFDKISTEYIGTTTGSTMHGWGLYFSKSRKIAKYYRESFTPFELNGQELRIPQDIPQDMVERLEDAMEWKKERPEQFERYVENVENRLERSKQEYKKLKAEKHFTASWQAENVKERELEKKLVDGIKNGTLKHDLSKGQIIRARIPANKYMLKENIKFEEQSPLVKDALLQIAGKYNVDKRKLGLEKTLGHSIYNQIVNNIFAGNKKKASLELYKYGIKGIIYDEDATENFVVFNDKDIRIEKINRTGDSLDAENK